MYAHPYIARGSAAAQALGFTAGQSFREASATEQAARRQAGWYGRGGYIGGVAGGMLGGFAGTAAAGAAIFASKGALAGLGPTMIKGATMIGSAAGSEIEDRLRARFSTC